LILQVFTHKSLRRPKISPADYGDNERLSDLGKAALDVALTHALFRRRPYLEAADISKQREFFLSSDMIENWVSYYQLKPKLCCDPKVAQSLNSPQETSALFHAYVGGLYVSSGPQAVNNWISRLLEQEIENISGGHDVATTVQPPQPWTPPQKRAKSETLSPRAEEPAIFFASQPPPSPPGIRHAPPHLLNPLAPAQPNLPFLPLFNQAAMQRRVTVEYLAEFSGPSHAGRWLVKCIVNGICKGEGSGMNKQQAKEEAAWKAYYSMGWT
jgi:dsRNA-specific ribonuclease